jgi:hypothetical protein
MLTRAVVASSASIQIVAGTVVPSAFTLPIYLPTHGGVVSAANTACSGSRQSRIRTAIAIAQATRVLTRIGTP